MKGGKRWAMKGAWTWRTAVRDARGSRGQALLYTFSMALGIAALVALGSVGADLDQAIMEQTRNLLGSDLVVRGRAPFSEKTRALFDSMAGESTDLVQFTSMAYFPGADQTTLCRVRAVQGRYPFYGALETEPAQAAETYLETKGALVDRVLAKRMSLAIGDPVRLGRVDFTIAGFLDKEPGEPPIASLMGPRIYIPLDKLDETELVRLGSRVFYSRVFKLAPELDPDMIMAAQAPLLNKERLRWETARTRRETLSEAMSNLGGFLNLIGCLALLLGGLGVGGAVYYHLKRKVRQIAVMRCLGATVKGVTAVYLTQVGVMSLFAGMLGVGIGIGIQFLIPSLIAELLPFSFEPGIHPGAVLLALGWGLLMSFILAGAPLASIRKISPMLSFRPDLAPQKRDWVQWSILAAPILVWWIFAVVQTQSFRQGSLFTLFLVGAVGLLYLTARTLGWIARRLLSPRLPFAWRHGLANLFRPQNQTFVFMIILGMGVFLITILAATRAMLLGQFDQALSGDRPNFLAFDVQPDQVQPIEETIRALGFPVHGPIPLVPMRLESLKGQPVSTLLETDIPEWTLRHEYRCTYRGELSDTEKLVEGAWVSKVTSAEKIIPVSMERDIAETLELALGDVFTVDVLGVSLELRIASIREVAWQSMQPNFYIVFPEGVLESAPRTALFATRTTGPEDVARLQNSLVARFPNVSCVDLTQVVISIDEIMNKAAAVIRLLAGLCMLTGLVLLGSAIWNGRYQRLGEQALLRTLGATRRQLVRIGLIEYALLGLFAALTGLILAIGAGWSLATFLFKVPPFPDLFAWLAPVLALPLLTLLLGYLSMRDIWRTSPRAVLRQEQST